MADETRAETAIERHRLQVGSTVAQTFRIFGRAPLLFLFFGVIGLAPDIIQLLAKEGGVSSSTAADTSAQIIDMLTLCLTQTAMTYYAIRLTEQRVPHLGEALWLGVRRYLPMVGTTFLTLLAIGAGFLLLVVPGVLLALRFAVAAPVCAIEHAGPIASMDRSAMLTEGSRWSILGIYAIFFLPMLAVVGLMAQLATTRDDRLFEWLFTAVQVGWGPLIAILPAVIYISLRRFKENVGVARVFD